MKDYLPLEWQELPRYESGSLGSSLRKSAREHGYHSALWFGLIRLKDHWFNNWLNLVVFFSTKSNKWCLYRNIFRLIIAKD